MKINALCVLLLTLLFKVTHAATAENEAVLTPLFAIQADDWRARIASLAFSPDNKILASGGGTDWSIGSYGEVKLWNATNGQLIKVFKGHGGEVGAVAFSPNGKLLAGGGYKLTLYDVAKRKKIKRLNNNGLVHALTFSPDGKTLVTACRGQPYAQVWDVETGGERLKLHAGTEREQTVRSVDFARNGSLFAMGGYGQPCTVWDPKTWLRRAVLTNTPLANESAEHVRFSPSGERVLTKGDFKIAGKLWNVAERKVVLELQGDDDLVGATDFSSDGLFLATAGMERMNLWDTRTGRRVRSLRGNFYSVAFSPDSKLLAVGAYGGTLQVLRVDRK